MPGKRSPKKSPKKSLSPKHEKKGHLVNVSTLPKKTQKTVSELSKKHEGVKQLREYSNGSVGAYFKDGHFRFVKGADRVITKKEAKHAFHKYYRERTSTAENQKRGNKQAKKYDLMHTKNVISDSRYLRNPNAYDFLDVDTAREMSGGATSRPKKLEFVVDDEEPWIAEARKRAFPTYAGYDRAYRIAPKSDRVKYMDVKKLAGKK